MKAAILILGSAALAGAAIGVAPLMSDQVRTPARYPYRVSGCRVTDGDTIRCGAERIRLLGIDAPELPGHCAEGRECAPGDGFASTTSLENATTDEMEIQRVGEDRYGRTLAMVAGPKGDLSCWQLAHGQAIYKQKWDNGYRVARACPSAVQQH